MIKFDDLLNQAKSISGLSGTKYILSTATNNSGALDGAELIPIDLGGRLVSQSSAPIPVNDLGKQLLRASASGDVDAVKALLTRGAPFTTDWLGTSPLHFAAQNNHLEITEILLRAGISKDAKTKVERTPLHLAVFEGYTEIVDTLVKHGADIECRDLLDMTPLHWAVQRGYLDVVECLIRNGAQIDVQNKFDLTPLDIAQQIQRSDIECRINDSLRNAAAASQNLVIQLSSDGNENQDCAEDMELDSSNHESIIIPIEPSMMSQFVNETSEPEEELSQSGNDEYFQEQDPESIEKENEQLVSNVNVDTANFSDSLKLLQAHGITMLQTDENEDGNILNTVMESGHSVVLTDVGKEVLNSVKQSEQQRQLQMQKKIVQVTPEEFLAMANGTVGNKNVYKQLKVLPSKAQVKRIVVKKGKAVPITNVSKVNTEQSSPNQTTNTPPSSTEMELMMAQLIEARKTIEEYKIKLKKKEQEVEEYKLQIKVLLDPKYC